MRSLVLTICKKTCRRGSSRIPTCNIQIQISYLIKLLLGFSLLHGKVSRYMYASKETSKSTNVKKKRFKCLSTCSYHAQNQCLKIININLVGF